MRHLLRWPALVVFGAGLLASSCAAPLPIAFSVTGYFDPGTSGATASNGDPISTLTKGSAVVYFAGGPVHFILGPGDSLEVPIGSLWGDCDDPEATVNFDGATLALAVTVDEPPALPPMGVFDGFIRGEVNLSSALLSVLWGEPLDCTFSVEGCLPADLVVKMETPTRYLSGMPPEDVMATFTLVKPDIEKGDVTGEGVVDQLDVLAALRIWGGQVDSSCAEVFRGDMNDDGNLDLIDAVSISRLVNGL